MTVEYRDEEAVFQGTVGAEDAEALLEWLQGRPGRRVDLTACRHLHSSSLQVLMAIHPLVAAWPEDSELATWLQSALRTV